MDLPAGIPEECTGERDTLFSGTFPFAIAVMQPGAEAGKIRAGNFSFQASENFFRNVFFIFSKKTPQHISPPVQNFW
ncbi:MAG: hypothetical protein LUQ66_12745 [Methanoregula sp.]|nr:hypothetical protein [Methanoregula sp.]